MHSQSDNLLCAVASPIDWKQFCAVKCSNCCRSISSKTEQTQFKLILLLIQNQFNVVVYFCISIYQLQNNHFRVWLKLIWVDFFLQINFKSQQHSQEKKKLIFKVCRGKQKMDEAIFVRRSKSY